MNWNPTDNPTANRFFRPLVPFIRPLVARLASTGLDLAEIESATHWRILRAYPKLVGRAEAEVHAYIRMSVRSAAVDAARRQATRRVGGDFDEVEPVAPAPSVEEVLEVRDELEAVLAAIEALTEDDRKIIWWAAEGMSNGDIGAHLGRSTTAVGTQLCKVRKRLRHR